MNTYKKIQPLLKKNIQGTLIIVFILGIGTIS